MKAVLGLGVDAREVTALLVRRRKIVWAGSAPYASVDDLADVIGRLAAEAPVRPRRARVVLQREVVQLRTVTPAPPLRPSAARRYAAIETGRLFRTNGVPLVTDAVVVEVGREDGREAAGAEERRNGSEAGGKVAKGRGASALWVAAATEPLVRAAAGGCEQAGIWLVALGPAADVLPAALGTRSSGEVVMPNGSSSEVLSVGRNGVWRSRLVRRSPAQLPATCAELARLGPDALRFAAAFGAARSTPRLSLLPPDTVAARAEATRQRVLVLGVVALSLWLIAATLHVIELAATARVADRELVRLGPALDSALALRQDVTAATDVLLGMETAERSRSRTLPLLADLTGTLGDSVFLVALGLGADSTLRLAGYAPNAARVLADLERLPWFADGRMEGVPIREVLPAPAPIERERFAIAGRVRRAP